MALRAAALALHACLLAALHPSDPNVCSYWERESPRITVGGGLERGVQATRPPVPTGRIAYRTAYRQAVRTDYRRRYHCCLGYYESRDACVPRCTHECVHGRCVAPDRCQCEPGWRGICSTPCPPGRFGPDCRGECRCHNGGSCDPVSGQCQCAPGFTGEQCREQCPAGKYGQDCRESCDCANGGRCYHVDGACLCEAGFLGGRCEERRCLEGLYGLRCENRCLCHPQHSQSCAAGWRGPRCRQPCLNGTFGSGCSQQCSCAHAAGCDPVTGTCHCLPGWTERDVPVRPGQDRAPLRAW
uniref:Platelet endothelial aggregation receptor 1 n=1 Tax=Apteryx owenii TaxID=8824 RepID=A0A8B9S9H3_APTOW